MLALSAWQCAECSMYYSDTYEAAQIHCARLPDPVWQCDGCAEFYEDYGEANRCCWEQEDC